MFQVFLEAGKRVPFSKGVQLCNSEKFAVTQRTKSKQQEVLLVLIKLFRGLFIWEKVSQVIEKKFRQVYKRVSSYETKLSFPVHPETEMSLVDSEIQGQIFLPYKRNLFKTFPLSNKIAPHEQNTIIWQVEMFSRQPG